MNESIKTKLNRVHVGTVIKVVSFNLNSCCPIERMKKKFQNAVHSFNTFRKKIKRNPINSLNDFVRQ